MLNLSAKIVDGPLARGAPGQPGLIPMGSFEAGKTYPKNALVTHGGAVLWLALRPTNAEPNDLSIDWKVFLDVAGLIAGAVATLTQRANADHTSAMQALAQAQQLLAPTYLQAQMLASLTYALSNLPTVLPAQTGRLWNNGGVLQIS